MATPDRDARIALRERRAQRLLAVRAFEECDVDRQLLGEAERSKATRRALAVTGLAAADTSQPIEPARRIEALTRRARLLFDMLDRRVAGLRGMIAVSSMAGATVPAVMVAATLAGVLGNALGPWRRINLLALPLFGLWLWNLANYALVAARAVGGLRSARLRRLDGVHAARSGWTLSGAFVRLALRRYVRAAASASPDEPARRLVARAVTRYAALWHRAARTLLARRVSTALHAGSACVVAGLIGGMYVRALAFEYRVGWESTLLEPAQVQALFDVLLGPAAAIMGIAVPDVAGLRVAGGDPLGGANAATWIHLFALTSAGLVLVPRTVLALYASARAHGLSRRVPVALDDPYYRRAFVAIRGGSRRIEIVPYSFRPRQTATHMLSCSLAEHFGARAIIEQREPLAYGEEPQAESTPDDTTVCRVLLLNAAQTPEPEVHGELLNRARERADETGDELLVGIDIGEYRSQPARRSAERLRQWHGLVADAGLGSIVVDPARTVDDALLRELDAAVYRPAPPEPR